MMVIDTSALIAILSNEPERRVFNRRIAAAAETYISAATLLEARIVLFADSAIRRFSPWMLSCSEAA